MTSCFAFVLFMAAAGGEPVYEGQECYDTEEHCVIEQTDALAEIFNGADPEIAAIQYTQCDRGE